MTRKFGCLKDPVDERDIFFRSAIRSAELPSKVEWPTQMDFVWDQADEGSCTGHGAGAAFVNALRVNRMPDMTPSRQMIYYNGRRNAYKDQDSGACIRDVIKGLRKYGVCPEYMWPYVGSNIFEKPSKHCYREAERHQIIRYEAIPKNEALIKAAIASGYGVVFGLMIYESFMGEEAAHTGVIPVPDDVNENCYGGHCMYIAGYNAFEKSHFDVLNSWGPSWGNKGRCHIPDEYLMTQGSDFWVIYLTE